ncbi:MAG: VanZ family protein [Planctomycetia bacterium]|nr:VanZ family protein [Planctomycetia bacterium]
MFRIVSFGSLGAYWLAIFIGTHMPQGIQSLGGINDKLLHFGAYAGLAFLLAAALTSLRVRHGVLLLPMTVAAVYGCLDELSQIPILGRRAEVADLAADMFGAGVGVIAFCILSFAVVKVFAPLPTTPCKAATESVA